MSGRQRGYSLLELALALALMGLLAFVAVALTPRLSAMFQERARLSALESADRAVTGFALLHGRLPCPDVNADGREDCAAGNVTGELPFLTMGLPSGAGNRHGVALRYGVFRKPSSVVAMDADLVMLKSRQTPLLPASVASVNLNGLDFCLGLRNAELANAGASALHVGANQSVAYVLVDPGNRDADGLNGLFDGVNGQTGVGFESPLHSKSATYDDTVRAIGFGELAGRLGCAAALARVNGLARSVFASYDMDRLAAFYKRFRAFDVRVQQAGVDMANVAMKIAIADTVITAASIASGLALSAQTGGVAAVDVALATAQAANATANLVLAINAVNSAQASLASARTLSAQAATAAAAATAFFNQRTGLLQRADAEGLLP